MIRKKCNTCGNTVNIVNKLVTIFAGHHDSFLVINNHFKHLFSTATSGSGQINVQMTLIPLAGTGKNCAIPSSLPRQPAPLPNTTCPDPSKCFFANAGLQFDNDSISLRF